LAYYTEEPKSDAPDASNITVVNNAGRSDTVMVTGLDANDMARVYDSAAGGRLLGYASVDEDDDEVTIRITQLGTASGSVYVSVTSTGAAESSRTRAGYSAEY
jgi:hypothetical protein